MKRPTNEIIRNKTITLNKNTLIIYLFLFMFIGIGITALVINILPMVVKAWVIETDGYVDALITNTTRGDCLIRIPKETEFTFLVCDSDLKEKTK